MWRPPLFIVLSLSLCSCLACNKQAESTPTAEKPPAPVVTEVAPLADEANTDKKPNIEPARDLPGFDTPQACIDALSDATLAKDFKRYLSCFSETAQNQQIGQIAYALQREAFYEKENSEKVIELFEHHDLLDLDIQGTLQIYSMRPEGVEMAFHVVGDRVRDKAGFLTSALAILGGDAPAADQLGELTELSVDGNNATGSLKTPAGVAPVIFRRIEDSWVIGAQNELPPPSDRIARQAFRERIEAQSDEQRQAISAIRRIGGTIEFQEQDPGRPVIAVSLRGPSATDDLLAQVKAFTHLKSLDLRGAEIQGPGLAQLEGLQELREINLNDTKIDDANLVHLNKLIALTKISLDGPQITDAGLANLNGLSNLQTLNLFGCKVSGEGLADLEALPNLIELELGGFHLTDDGLASLKRLHHLQSLGIASATINDAGLANLKGIDNLKKLTLQCTSITDAGLLHLHELGNLQELSFIDAVRVTSDGIQQLKTALPTCSINYFGQFSK